jgi:hypothetical protein
MNTHLQVGLLDLLIQVLLCCVPPTCSTTGTGSQGVNQGYWYPSQGKPAAVHSLNAAVHILLWYNAIFEQTIKVYRISLPPFITAKTESAFVPNSDLQQ